MAPPRIGAHVPTAGGLVRGACAAARAMGAETIQIFASNPRGWAQPGAVPAEAADFRQACAQAGIRVYVHAPYLINLGSPDEELGARSADALRWTCARARELGAAGVIVHAGSAGAPGARSTGLRAMATRLRPVLDRVASAGGPRILIEPTAGGGHALAGRVEDLRDYLALLEHHPGVGVCLDTCHVHAAGADLAVPGAMAEVLEALDDAAGPGRLGLVHANDSRDPAGSTRDRHANIGSGTIGLEAFAELLAHRLLAGVDVVVETPGGSAERGRDVATLRKLAKMTPSGHVRAGRRPGR